jgi:hypothetical protein
MGLGGQHPAEENLLLGGRAIRIDLDVGAPRRQPLELAHCGNALGALEVMDEVDRDRRGKAVVRERQLDAVSEMQPPDNFGLAVHQRISEMSRPNAFQTRTRLHQVFDEESFAGPDIEHTVAGA